MPQPYLINKISKRKSTFKYGDKELVLENVNDPVSLSEFVSTYVLENDSFPDLSSTALMESNIYTLNNKTFLVHNGIIYDVTGLNESETNICYNLLKEDSYYSFQCYLYSNFNKIKINEQERTKLLKQINNLTPITETVVEIPSFILNSKPLYEYDGIYCYSYDNCSILSASNSVSFHGVHQCIVEGAEDSINKILKEFEEFDIEGGPYNIDSYRIEDNMIILTLVNKKGSVYELPVMLKKDVLEDFGSAEQYMAQYDQFIEKLHRFDLWDEAYETSVQILDSIATDAKKYGARRAIKEAKSNFVNIPKQLRNTIPLDVDIVPLKVDSSGKEIDIDPVHFTMQVADKDGNVYNIGLTLKNDDIKAEQYVDSLQEPVMQVVTQKKWEDAVNKAEEIYQQLAIDTKADKKYRINGDKKIWESGTQANDIGAKIDYLSVIKPFEIDHNKQRLLDAGYKPNSKGILRRGNTVLVKEGSNYKPVHISKLKEGMDLVTM